MYVYINKKSTYEYINIYVCVRTVTNETTYFVEANFDKPLQQCRYSFAKQKSELKNK